MLNIFKFRAICIAILYSLLVISPSISLGSSAILENNDVLLFQCSTKTPLQFIILYNNKNSYIYFNKYNAGLLIEHDPILDIQEKNITEGRFSTKKIVKGRVDNTAVVIFVPPPSDDIDNSYLEIENPATMKTDIFICNHNSSDQLEGGSSANDGIYNIDKFAHVGSIAEQLNWINIR